ncbi:Putative LOC101858828 [Caligus rogercresseyi]|uniref:LOC101858828 n=1 Tax=Caligus rogercresseyi TaxID=217165 RepID=A0A7T8GZR4_CALRO|nr:Putative LOC101858828 [Caligus rogercresseyi]
MSTPNGPFEEIFADYFDLDGQRYLIVGDRFTGWTEVYLPSPNSHGAKGLISALRRYLGTFGVPNELSSDGGPEFTSIDTKEFLQKWGINHRISSAYNPQSNGRAEVSVKATKRLLRGNSKMGVLITIHSYGRSS